MALFYADASALVKLVRDEPESAALRAFLADADLVSCELVLTEVPRAIWRAALHDPQLPVDLLLARGLAGWGDAVLTGMIVAVFVAFRPEWLATTTSFDFKS